MSKGLYSITFNTVIDCVAYAISRNLLFGIASFNTTIMSYSYLVTSFFFEYKNLFRGTDFIANLISIICFQVFYISNRQILFLKTVRIT